MKVENWSFQPTEWLSSVVKAEVLFQLMRWKSLCWLQSSSFNSVTMLRFFLRSGTNCDLIYFVRFSFYQVTNKTEEIKSSIYHGMSNSDLLQERVAYGKNNIYQRLLYILVLPETAATCAW